MNFTRRAIAALLIGASSASWAAFPEKPIRVVIGFPAGGPLDQHARLLSERLQTVLGQPVIIDYTDVTARLSDAFRQVMTTPDIRSRMVAQGADPAFLGSEAFAKFLGAEMPRWADAVKKSGARLD